MTKHSFSQHMLRTFFPAALIAAALAFLPMTAVTVRAEGHSDFKQDLKNARLELAVHLKLMDKLGVDGVHIDVDANAGHVVLSGTLKKPASRDLAKEVALSVDGVKSVDNRLRLVNQQPSKVKRAVHQAEHSVQDAMIETHVKMRLMDNLGKNAFHVEVGASHGVVSLRGTLPNRHYRDIALATARRTKGVTKVIDLIKTK